jgi:hypothetical protein
VVDGFGGVVVTVVVVVTGATVVVVGRVVVVVVDLEVVLFDRDVAELDVDCVDEFPEYGRAILRILPDVRCAPFAFNFTRLVTRGAADFAMIAV